MEQQQNDKSTLVFIILGWVFSVLSFTSFTNCF